VRVRAEGRLVGKWRSAGREFFFPSFFFMGKAAGGVWRVEVGVWSFFFKSFAKSFASAQEDKK